MLAVKETATRRRAGTPRLVHHAQVFPLPFGSTTRSRRYSRNLVFGQQQVAGALTVSHKLLVRMTESVPAKWEAQSARWKTDHSASTPLTSRSNSNNTVAESAGRFWGRMS